MIWTVRNFETKEVRWWEEIGHHKMLAEIRLGHHNISRITASEDDIIKVDCQYDVPQRSTLAHNSGI